MVQTGPPQLHIYSITGIGYNFLTIFTGWTNDDSKEWFTHFADFCFKTFGDRVKMWVTIYDPYSISYKGYSGIHAPGQRFIVHRENVIILNVSIVSAVYSII